MRINGMSIFFAVFNIIVAVIARSSHTFVANRENGLQFTMQARTVVHWSIDPYAPTFSFIVFAAHGNFATYFDHIIFHAVTLEQIGHHITGIAFGNCRSIELNTWIGFHDFPVFQPYFFIADELLQTIDKFRGYVIAVFEPKSPSVYEGRNGDVEFAIGYTRYLHCFIEHGNKKRIGLYRLIPVNFRNNGTIVERIQRIIEFFQFSHNFVV